MDNDRSAALLCLLECVFDISEVVTVNRAESDQMVAALQDRGIEVVYILEEDEGHMHMLLFLLR